MHFTGRRAEHESNTLARIVTVKKNTYIKSVVLIPNTTANCAITYFNILRVCDRTYTLLCLTSGSYCSIFNLAFAGGAGGCNEYTY